MMLEPYRVRRFREVHHQRFHLDHRRHRRYPFDHREEPESSNY